MGDWDPRFHFLSDEEIEQLIEDNPQFRSDPEEYCPTCLKEGSYTWQGEVRQCDCEMQLALHKHYLNAGIGVLYQRQGWTDLSDQVSDQVLLACTKYLENHVRRISRGIGFLFHGEVGTGKTMVANLLLKEFVKKGYRCYGTTFANMVDMFTAGWNNLSDQRRFNNKIKKSQILLLDDVGREMRTKTKLSESTFDNVLRTRVQSGLVTILTTNLTLDELSSGYGAGALSLIRETNLHLEFKGDDFRPQAFSRSRVELERGDTRPIV